jgi:DNA-binding CsgD family transcriptional regulator
VSGASYCSGPECDTPTSEGRNLCWAHYKQMKRHGRLTVIKPTLTPMDRFFDACERWVNASSEDDREYEAARRGAIQVARQVIGNHGHSVAVKDGLTKARARGVRLGRPPRLTAAEAERLVRELGGTRSAARRLGISRTTVLAALRRNAVHGTENNVSCTTNAET